MLFSSTFFPTPRPVLEQMASECDIRQKVVYDPSAGKGDIIDYCKEIGAAYVYGTEINKDLREILKSKCKLIGEDFLQVTSDQVSHIDLILMNPPFDKGAEHINHAYKIAPAGCRIIALCNLETVKNPYSKSREELKALIDTYGSFTDIGEAFTTAERKTGVEVAMIRLEKPGSTYNTEFAGFFMEEEQEEQANGLIRYNEVRDLVNRYVESIKIFDQQLETAVRMNELQAGYFDAKLENISISFTRKGAPVKRNEFKKEMQRQGWSWIFSKLNLQKHSTQGLREDINKFVEKQTQVPFTMRNIYKMIEIVIGTTGSRMDKALLEVFDKVTAHHHENRHGLEGWKTNSHYLLTKRFILPSYFGNEGIEDMLKAICYLTGENYDKFISLREYCDKEYFLQDKEGNFVGSENGYNRHSWHAYQVEKYDEPKNILANHPEYTLHHFKMEYGKWFDWSFFRVRKYMKGTIHFEFKDEKVWAKFNATIARLKGYPLPEKKEQTNYQKRQTYTRDAQGMKGGVGQKVYATFDI